MWVTVVVYLSTALQIKDVYDVYHRYNTDRSLYLINWNYDLRRRVSVHVRAL